MVWMVGVSAPSSVAGVRPPDLGVDFPDPDLVRDGATWYMFATNSTGFGNVPVAVSSDLDNWQVVGDALPRLGGWASQGFTWAPSVASIGGGWTLFYTANDTDSGRQCIGHAVASNPTGPYVDTSDAPFVCQLDHGGSIDPTVYRNRVGELWLVWKSDDNAIGDGTHIWSQELSDDGTALVGSPTLLLSAESAVGGVDCRGASDDRLGRQLVAVLWSGVVGVVGLVDRVCGVYVTGGAVREARFVCTVDEHVELWRGRPVGSLACGVEQWDDRVGVRGMEGAIGYSLGGQRQPSIEPLDVRSLPPQWRPDRPRNGPIEPDLSVARSFQSLGGRSANPS